MDNQNLFAQTYDQIRASITGSGNVNFQMLGNPIDFSWPVAPLGQLSLQAYQLMSVMPQWSPIGVYGASDARFFDAYVRVMSLITYQVNPQKVNDLQNLKDQVTGANNQLQQIITNANSAYQTALQNGGDIFTAQYPDMKSWLAGPGSTYLNDTTDQTALVKKLQDQYATLAAAVSIDPSLQQDFAKIVRPTGPVSGPAPSGWTKVPNSAGDLDWQPSFDIATSGQDWRAKLTSGSIGQFSVKLDASKGSSSLSDTWASGSAGYDAFFWGVQAGGGWTETDFTESDQSVTAQIDVKSSTLVPVTPGAWYDGGLMKSLASSSAGYGAKLTAPWVATGGPGSQSAFGQYGILSARISGLVVAFQPSFSITMQSSTYARYSQQIQASGGLRIGPFQFGGGGGSNKVKVSQSGNSTTLTGGSTSDDPLIIGMTVVFPGTGEA